MFPTHYHTVDFFLFFYPFKTSPQPRQQFTHQYSELDLSFQLTKKIKALKHDLPLVMSTSCIFSLVLAYFSKIPILISYNNICILFQISSSVTSVTPFINLFLVSSAAFLFSWPLCLYLIYI